MDRELTTDLDRSLKSDQPTRAALASAQLRRPRRQRRLRGSVLVLIQFDVCEEIRLDELRKIFGARTAEASFKHQAPGYVRYQRPPVEESARAPDPRQRRAPRRPDQVLRLRRRQPGLRASRSPATGTRSSSSPAAGPPTPTSKRSPRASSSRSSNAPRQRWSSPTPASGCKRTTSSSTCATIAGAPSANDLLAAHGDHIAQVVRGEMAMLSEGERQEILQSRISYYPNDLAVIGWNAAFIYDTDAGAETAIQLLQYANSQLLEFRHYDELLTKELENVYDFLEAGGTGLVVALAHGARRRQAAHRPARRERTHRTRRQRHQVPQRHVLRAPLQTVRRKKSASPTTKTWSKKNSRPPKTSTASWWSNSTSAAPSCWN